MIPRYSRPEMVAIWTPERRFQIMLEVELLACEAMESRGEVPEGTTAACRAKASFDIPRIDELERTLKHDVIAFLTNVAEYVGEPARHLHKGMTSSDVLDTSLAVQLREAGLLIRAGLDAVLDALERRAREHVDTLCIGRSHGIHAEPTTFGWKLAILWDELRRGRDRLDHAIADISVGMISGAVGTWAHLDPSVEAFVCAKLGLTPAPASNQVIQRDRHAYYFSVLALIATSIEKIAVEIRHLQRTEVLEAEEPFTPGQKGSSAMPHKRNPVLSENLTGLARIVRGMVVPALENVALWHERDISHSSVERMIGPDATVTLDFALHRLAGLIERLVVYPANLAANLDRLRGLVHSQRVLLALTQKGASREDAYRLVQRNAMKVWEAGADFRAELCADAEVRAHLTEAEIGALFDLAHHLRHVDTIFARVFAD